MTIDINKLRRLAQAATHPMTKGRWVRLFGERTVYDRLEDGCRGIPVVSTPVHPPHQFEAACLDFIAAANPAAISELLDRLEAAEKERDDLRAEVESWKGLAQQFGNEADALRAAVRHEADCVEAAKAEIVTLRARIEAMEKQEPVAKVRVHQTGGNAGLAWSVAPLNDFDSLPLMRDGDKLYALPGAQPAPSVPDDVMRDAERYRYLRGRDDSTAGVGCWLEAGGKACARGWLNGDQLDRAIDCAIEALAAAPEAKPCP